MLALVLAAGWPLAPRGLSCAPAGRLPVAEPAGTALVERHSPDASSAAVPEVRPRPCGPAADAASGDGLGDRARLALGGRLRLNCADANTLSWLAAVPRRAAEGLVAHRAAHGPYVSERGLRAAPHIGAATARRLAAAGDFDWPCRVASLGGLGSPGSGQSAAWPPKESFAREHGVQQPWLVPLLRFLPASAISRAWGWLVRVRRPAFFATWLKTTFVAAVGIDMADSAAPIESFSCLEDLFVRQLRAGARPIDDDAQVLVSPTDSTVGANGTVTAGELFQIKGQTYRLAELLGDEERARQFEGGGYMTLYLSPRDYHRIHAPAAGHVTAAHLLPGRLLPVFPAALTKDAHLLARNERIITYLRSIDASELALVAVGATLVGRMRVNYDPSLRGNVSGAEPRKVRYSKPTWLERGEELGAFELGSTVVLLCQKDKVEFDPLAPGTPVRMGKRIGRAKKAARERDRGGEPTLLKRDNSYDR